VSGFIFVRHGQSTANADRNIATDTTPLTDTGKSQARATALEINKLGIKTIACSPLTRAQQTAEIIAAELGIEISDIKLIDELKERDLGNLKGKSKQHESHYYYTVNNEHNVESYDEIINRMKRAVQRINELNKKGPLLVVGHAVSGYYLIEVAKGRDKISEFEEPEEIMNADFVEVELSDNRGEL
jgi:uncharacterized phosphatase